MRTSTLLGVVFARTLLAFFTQGQASETGASFGTTTAGRSTGSREFAPPPESSSYSPSSAPSIAYAPTGVASDVAPGPAQAFAAASGNASSSAPPLASPAADEFEGFLPASRNSGSAPAPSPKSGSGRGCDNTRSLEENLQGRVYRPQAARDSYTLRACCRACSADDSCLAFTFNLEAGYTFGCFLRRQATRGSQDDLNNCPRCLSGLFGEVQTNNRSITTDLVVGNFNDTALDKERSNITAAESAAGPVGGPGPPASGSVDCTQRQYILENLQTTARDKVYKTQDAYDADSIGGCCEVCYVDPDCLAFTFTVFAGPTFGCFLRTEAVRGSMDDIDGCPGCLSGLYTNLTFNANSLTSAFYEYSLTSAYLAEMRSNSSSGNGRRKLRGGLHR